MRYNKKELKLRVDFNNMMSKSVGHEGFSERQIASYVEEVEAAFAAVAAGRG